ncbi:MAG: hypothetical protein HYU68_05745 [Bacteroidetes bacterium]|nr:hypothetical protein [Bacteroidota bacterium]
MDKKPDSNEYEIDIFKNTSNIDFSEKIKIKRNNVLLIFRRVMIGLRTETRETKQATKIAIKYISKGSITKEEEFELRQQVYDVLKTLGIGVPFALIPGASILIPILIKVAQKKGINLLPSAFDDNSKDSVDN